MKILVICQYYYPEPFRITDICEEFVRRGHEVVVVTGTPNYPEGKIYPGYEHGRKRDETLNGVRIHRCPLVPRKTGVLFRLLNYFSFPITSSRYARSKACAPADGGTFDVVFVNQLSPVMMARAGLVYMKKHNVPSLLYCLDLWPESLVAGGASRGSLLYRIFHTASRRFYRQVDRILVTSRMFQPYLQEQFDIAAERISYLPQYAEALFDELPPREPDGATNLAFAGNIGFAQSVETILRAAELVKDEPVRFHIVGGGADLERLQALAKELELANVTFYGRRPVEEMPAFYAKADAMLVTLRVDPVLSLTLPGKVQSYMAAGKPIIGAIDGETAEVIRDAQCGFWGPAEDVQTLAENIRKFAALEDKAPLGRSARMYYEAHFEKERFMDLLEREL